VYVCCGFEFFSTSRSLNYCKNNVQCEKCGPFLVCNFDAFVLTVGLCFAEHCYVACCYQVVQNNSNDGINSCKAYVTLQICIIYKPEKSVILLSANLGLERRWIRGKTRDYLLHRALRRQIFQQKWKVMCNVSTFLSVL